MRRPPTAQLLPFVLFSIGCGGGGGSTAPSSCPAFTRIVAGDFGRTNSALWWTLEVAEMPAQLTFNRTGVPPNVLEYRWGVDIDADRDGTTDLRAAVTHYRQAGAAERTTGDILSVTAEDLWSVFGAGSSTTGDINVTLTGNTFRLEAALAEDAKLTQVTARTQSTWTTFHMHGPNLLTDQCESSLH